MKSKILQKLYIVYSKGEDCMSRRMVEVETLHGYTLEELLAMKKTYKSNYSYTVLLAVTMRYQKVHTEEIAKILGLSKITILEYIHKWNELGLESLKDHRGGSEGRFTDEMLTDLLDTVVHKCPTEEGFDSFLWTCGLLADYIEKKYNQKFSPEWIRQVLIKNNFSHKRGQYKSSCASEVEQMAFKKNAGPSRYCRKFF
jgi:hypothetical protein